MHIHHPLVFNVFFELWLNKDLSDVVMNKIKALHQDYESVLNEINI